MLNGIAVLKNFVMNLLKFWHKKTRLSRVFLIKFLKDNEIKEIIKNTKKILSKSIKLGGASIKDFSSSSGKKGSFQQYFSVYGKKGENCVNRKCIGKIKKIVISNRASFFCNKCQK